MATSPQQSYPSPTSRTKMRDLSEVSQDGYTAKRATAMLGKATTVAPRKGASEHPKPAKRKSGGTLVRSDPKAIIHLEEGSGRGDTEASQPAGSAPKSSGTSAARLQQSKSDGGDDDVVSLRSSAQTSRACELSQDEEDDEVVSLTSRSSSGSPVADARTQPPADSSAPATCAESNVDLCSRGDTEVEHEKDAPEGHLSPTTAAAASAQPSSTARVSPSLPREQGSPQV